MIVDADRVLSLAAALERFQPTGVQCRQACTPIHPGEILNDELEDTGLTASKLSELIQVLPNRLYQILTGKRSLTADTALRLGRYFGTSPDFWMNLQTAYELDLARAELGKSIERIPRRQASDSQPRPAA